MTKKQMQVRTAGRAPVTNIEDARQKKHPVGSQGVIYVNSVDEMVGRLSYMGQRFVQGYFETMSELLEEPGPFTIDLDEMASANEAPASVCLDAIFEVGEYMILDPEKQVWRRLCTPVWVGPDQGSMKVVVYGFPVRLS